MSILQPLESKPGNPKKFSNEYKDEVFIIWYNSGKPPIPALVDLIPPDPVRGEKPEPNTVRIWVKEIFVPRAELLDEQVFKELESRLVKEKIDMLTRHAETGYKMQDMAFKYLEENVEDLTISTSIRLLVEGIRIEKESRGLPQAMNKMISMSDEELLGEVEKLISEAPAKLEKTNG